MLIAIIAYRYRKHLQTAYFMWQTFRKFRRQMKPPEKQVEKKTRGGDTQLVRCPKCSKWTPQEEAVKLKQSFYCTLRCLEESVQFNK
jgi:hypothetical protein